MAAARFDYIVVGAGSAGCVLACRLSAAGAAVLVLEAGPWDRGWKIHMPAALTYNLMDDRYNWYYRTEPQARLDGRRLYWPRGRVVGGSSALNAMVYVRGHALDYDRWAFDEGAAGWSYAEVLPYFRRAESRSTGGDLYRGGDGPLKVWAADMANPLFRAFVEAGVQAGYGRTADMNGYRQEGFGRMDMTVHRGMRWSAARAYLRPALRRPWLTVVTGALAARVLVERGRAVGVDYVENHKPKRAYAEAEVILAGGAINSPQLLLLSGIGPADELKAADVAPVHDLPGVGHNLQDHLELYVQYACREPVTLMPAMRPHNMAVIGARWLLDRSGPGASSHLEAGAFIRSRPGVRHPDIQFHFLPALIDDHGRSPAKYHAFQCHVGPMRPASRGRLRLRSADPAGHPLIEPELLSEERDRREMRDCVRLAREIIAQPAFDRYRGDEIRPGPALQSDDAIDAFVRAKADSAYHPCGTCRMGQGEDAVVDPQCRVRGIEGLRVVDASVMPSEPSGNLNAPTIMLAEKASDMILDRPPLAATPVPVWEAPDWQTHQREATA
ncbi:MAG TPA: choline dehydrogenase [Geminicoccaceae bacterium]|nr:choline dehydrogenase [Geminicoccus sp.]HMU50412.1 choline dehydrogenase [Geminicoccaceae bacterium]